MADSVLVPNKLRPGAPPQEVARLGAGDFFGETALLEGRKTRNTDVICSTDVEVHSVLIS